MSEEENNNHPSVTTLKTNGATTESHIQHLEIRLAKNPADKWNVMRFNSSDFVPLAEWQHAKMWREKTDAQADDSFENLSLRSRKRMHQEKLKRKTEHKAWILNVNGKKGKQFRGTRAGGIGEHSTFYVFNTAPDGAIEAHRLDEFHNFQPVSRFTPLTAEEAEEEFKRRKRVMNLFTIMTRKRLTGDDKEFEEEELNVDGTKKSSIGELKISDMEEWMNSSDCNSETDNETEEKKPKHEKSDDESSQPKGAKKQNKIQPKKSIKKKHKPNTESHDKLEAFEDSDDGDEDGREMDYDSESSEGEPDIELKCAMKSVAEEDALRNLLTSEEEDEETDTEKQSDKSAEEKSTVIDEITEKKVYVNTNDSIKPSSLKKKSATLKSKNLLKTKTGVKNSENVANKPTKPQCSVQNKVKETEMPTEKPTSTATSALVNYNNDEQSHLEEITKRYLSRKPMSAVELLHKMKSKYNNLQNEELVEKMSHVLKKINPVKSVEKGKMIFSLKKKN